MIKKIAVLTSKNSWFVPYARHLVKILRKKKHISKLFSDHRVIPQSYDLVFILSYFEMVPGEALRRHKLNLVVHESDLPKGRGWSPLFWQILDGKNRIPIVLFSAAGKADSGGVYLKDHVILKGHELHHEIREAQAKKTINLCLKFIAHVKTLKPIRQRGRPTFYRKRTLPDSRVHINKSLLSQFDLLRIVNNECFPAFFYYRKHKYILHISKGAK